MRIRPIIFVCMLLSFLTPTVGNAASAYVVDDADIADPNTLQNENWISRTSKHETIAVANAAYQIMKNTEFTLEYAHDVQSGNHDDVLSPQIKYVWREGEGDTVRAAIVAGGEFTTEDTHFTNFYAYAPFSLQPVKDLDVNVNLGLERLPADSEDYATWGAGTEYHFTPQVSFVDEVFGRDNDRPGFQLGPRYEPTEQLAFDLIYGHNVFNDSDDIITAGLTVNW